MYKNDDTFRMLAYLKVTDSAFCRLVTQNVGAQRLRFEITISLFVVHSKACATAKAGKQYTKHEYAHNHYKEKL
jgi:hypothetical protein